MRFLVGLSAVVLSLMAYSGVSRAETLSCVTTSGCDMWSVTIDGSTAEIYQSNRCSQMDPLPKFLVGKYSDVTSKSDENGNVTYSAPDGQFTLLDQGRFGNTVTAILDGGQTINELFCQ